MAQSFADALNWVPTSRNLATTLARAFEYAKAQSHAAVTLEHLLLALVADPDASLVLQASNVDLSRLNADVSTYLAGLQDQRAAQGQFGDPVAGDDLVRILDYASAAARQSRRREINGAIVLAAVVGDARSPAASMLRAQGLTFEEAIKALQRAGTAARAPSEGAPGGSPGASELPAADPRAGPAGAAGSQPPSYGPPHGSLPAAPPHSLGGSLNAAHAEHGEPWRGPAAEAQPGPPNGRGPHPAAPASAEELLASARRRVETGRMASPPPAAPAVQQASRPPAPQGPAPAPSEHSAGPGPTGYTANGTGQHPHLADPPAASEQAVRPLDGPSPEPPAWPEPPPAQTAARPPLPPPPPGRPGQHMGEPAGPPPGHAPAGPPPPPRGDMPGPALRPPPVPPPHPGPRPPGPPQGRARPPWPEPPPGYPRDLRAEFEYDGYPAGAPYTHPDEAGAPQPAGGPPPRYPGRPSMVSVGPPGPTRAAALASAQISEGIPRRMRAGTTETVEVRIANADVLALAQGLQGPGAAYRHDLVLTKALAVRLRAPEGGFWIEPLSPETVWIDSNAGLVPDDYVSWRWTVTPQFRGRAPLQLIVSARTVGSDGLAAETALPDQTIEIKVRSNYRRTAARWAGWLVAAGIGAVLGRFSEELIALGKSFL